MFVLVQRGIPAGVVAWAAAFVVLGVILAFIAVRFARGGWVKGLLWAGAVIAVLIAAATVFAWVSCC